MAKALKAVAIVAGVAALAIVTGGAALGLGVALSTTAFGISAGTLLLVSSLAGTAAQLLTKGPQVPSAQTDRLNVSIDPRAFRKTVLGQTAFPTDIRYEEWSGTDQEYCDWIVAVASHAVDGVEEIWLNTEMVWSQVTGVTAKYGGYFSVPNIILEGSAANAFSFASGRWNGAARLTGCAYLRLRFKVTGNAKKQESPFASGIPSRITIIGRGAKLYDPRRDSTVPGGSGPMRAGDQSTWRYTADDGAVIGENLPLQILRVVLGWRIRNPVTGEMRLATGSGVPVKRLLLTSWITAANLADEQVNRSAGGTEPRYHGAGVVSEGEEPRVSLDAMCAACCARFRDTSGKLSIAIAHNDLANAATDDGLTDDDVIGGFTWDPDPSLAATPNVIRGRYVDASTNSLYQLIDYPEVRLASPDGQDRIFPLDLAVVESASQAQRIAKQVLQRKQYQREFTAPFDIRAWKYTVGDVLPFTFAPLSFTRALFRVKEQELGQGGTCNMTLSVENAQIYAFDRDDAAPVLAAEAVVYDASRNPLILAIDEAAENALRASSDGWLSPAEKRRAVIDLADLVSQRDTLTTKWIELGSPAEVADARNAAHARLSDLIGYLQSLTPAWNDASVSTPLADPALYRARWTNAASALNAFAAAITGRPGRNALAADLTNGTHILPARYDGTVINYGGAESVFYVRDAATDLTDSGLFAMSIIDNPQGLTIAVSGRYFRIEGGFDPSEDIATVTLRLTGSGQYAGYRFDQVFSLGKSKGGIDGSSPPLWSLHASAQTVRYNTAGAYIAGQSVRFIFVGENIAAGTPTVWQLKNADGNVLIQTNSAADFVQAAGPTYWQSPDPTTIVCTDAGVEEMFRTHGGAAGRWSLGAVPFGRSEFDTVAILKVQDGSKGDTGPRGPEGLPGTPGANGQTWYPYYAYANAPDGSVDFTTGEPGTRAYVGFGTGTSPIEPNSPIFYSWAPYRGPAFGLTGRDVAIAGNVLVKTGGTDGWNADAYSTSGYRGGAAIAFRGVGNQSLMGALNSDPNADTNFLSLDYAWYAQADGTASIFENGAYVGAFVSGYGTGLFEIIYNNKTIRYVYNGVTYREVPAPGGMTMYFDSSFATPGARMTDVSFIAVGSAGDNGTNGTNGANGKDGYSLSVSQTAFVIPSFANGTSKPEWKGGAVRVALVKGGQEVPADSYTFVAQSGMTSIAVSGQAITFADIIGIRGEFTARAMKDGVSFDGKVVVTRPLDGSAAFTNSATLTGVSDNASVTGSAAVPGGRTVTIAASASYETRRDNDGRGVLTIYWRNASTNGPLNLLGEEQGSVATNYNEGTQNEPSYRNNPGSVSVSRQFTSPSPDAQIEYRAAFSTNLGTTVAIAGTVSIAVSQ